MKYLPPDYDCTPSKLPGIKTETDGSTPKKITPRKRFIDRVEEGLETEVIHVMFYNEVYVVALGPSVYLLITPAKARETYCVQSIHLRATPITESHAP